jgi:hypothetical protein
MERKSAYFVNSDKFIPLTISRLKSVIFFEIIVCARSQRCEVKPMKKLAAICIVLVCAAIITAGSLSIHASSPNVSARSLSNNVVQSTTSTTHVASNPPIKTLKHSALTANQLSRRQSYGGPYYASSKSLAKRYHYPGCFEVANIDAENLVTFNTHIEACAAGLKPCVRCDPPPFNGASY